MAKERHCLDKEREKSNPKHLDRATKEEWQTSKAYTEGGIQCLRGCCSGRETDNIKQMPSRLTPLHTKRQSRNGAGNSCIKSEGESHCDKRWRWGSQTSTLCVSANASNEKEMETHGSGGDDLICCYGARTLWMSGCSGVTSQVRSMALHQSFGATAKAILGTEIVI